MKMLIAPLLISLSHATDSRASPSQYLDQLRAATVYSLNAAGLPAERALSVQAYQALKGTLTVDTIKLAAQGATTAGQLYLAALACHAGDRRTGEALIAKIDARTAVLSATGGALVYRSVKTIAEVGSAQNPCPG
jgi:hypothetical protein